LGQCVQIPHVLVPLIAALREKRETARESEIAQTTLIEAIVSLAVQLGDSDKALAVEALSGLLESRQTAPLAADQAVDGLRRIGTADARTAAIRYQTMHDTLDRVAFTQDRSGHEQLSHRS
jgi:hypothetical protein